MFLIFPLCARKTLLSTGRAAQRRGRVKLLALFYVADGACVKISATQTLGFDIFRKNALPFLYNLHTRLPSPAGMFAVFPMFFPLTQRPLRLFRSVSADFLHGFPQKTGNLFSVLTRPGHIAIIEIDTRRQRNDRAKVA